MSTVIAVVIALIGGFVVSHRHRDRQAQFAERSIELQLDKRAHTPLARVEIAVLTEPRGPSAAVEVTQDQRPLLVVENGDAAAADGELAQPSGAPPVLAIEQEFRCVAAPAGVI